MAKGNGTPSGRSRGKHRRPSSGNQAEGNVQGDGGNLRRGTSANPARKFRPHRHPKDGFSDEVHDSGGSGNGRTAGAVRYFTGKLNDFELFCAYHLGLDERGAYCPANVSDVARRFSAAPEDIERALAEYDMSMERIQALSFDLGLAKLDIEVAPPGIDRVELARTIFQEFRDARSGLDAAPHYLVNSQDSSARMQWRRGDAETF